MSAGLRLRLVAARALAQVAPRGSSAGVGLPSTAAAASRCFSGGHGHAPAAAGAAHGHAAPDHVGHDDHGHGHGDPRSESHLFGEHLEWEVTHYLVLAGCVVIGAAFMSSSNTNPHDWARDEAEERNRRRAEGKPVEFGVNYAAIRYMRESKQVSGERADELEAGKLAPAPGPLTSNRTV